MKRTKQEIIQVELDKIWVKFQSKFLELHRTERDISGLLNYFSELTNSEVFGLDFTKIDDKTYEVKLRTDL